MILAEPSPTPADLHFRLFGFPVRVHPFFWLICLLLSGGGEPRSVLIWIVAVFASIVVHELGHAFAQRHYGGRSRIVLYGMGGLAIGEGVRDTPWRQVLISLAGPFAGFLLATLLYLLLVATGVPAEVRFTPLPRVVVAQIDSLFANELLRNLFYINIMWGILNLAPIYPLDGGRVSRELFTMWLPPHRGVIASLWVSVLCAVALGGYLFTLGGGLWSLLLFGMLAYNNYQMLQAYQSSRGGRW
ncbi:Peptidase family M50 [Posidoniimonas polymericola]|uniref:Peptidase family M50 n=1 Tax=Posidoniimonas polymericola TaxID=2528002 RepID=A0A5C5YSJ3_9BACT|nr:M50 family metallopeptidase [Posidoniimonas polymericola]TWT77730.1 Peptidase family M50 [Posidoniimonas polymericola]